MKVSMVSLCALSSCVAAAMLAACGGSQPPIGALGAMPLSVSEHAGASTYDASAPLLYVTNTTADYDDVKIYHANAKDPSAVAVITDKIEFPVGDCIDGKGTLYVTNIGTDLGFVSEYAAGKTKSTTVITKGIDTPVYCAIDGDGNLWVTNVGNSSVTEYRQGSIKPSTTITDGVTDPHGIAFDRSGNMYVSNVLSVSSYKSDVVVYAPGHKSPSRTLTDALTNAGGVAVDAKGTLYVANFAQCNVVEYLSGQDQPYQEITDGIDGPTGLTIGKNGWLYVVNTGFQACSADGPANVVLEFAPGALKPSAREISKGVYTPEGSAYNPPLLP